MLRDYKVTYRREETLAAAALRCRRFAGNENSAMFNIVYFFEKTLPLILMEMGKCPLQYDFFDAAEGEKPAFVTYDPLTLHIDKEIWELARIGEPEARFIVAHELGHILFHDHHAQAFSADPNGTATFVEKEERAEWQASAFGSHFLVTRPVLEMLGDADSVTQACAVPRELATSRISDLEEENRRKERFARARGYTGDPCTDCGNFTLRPSGLTVECDTCGAKFSIERKVSVA